MGTEAVPAEILPQRLILRESAAVEVGDRQLIEPENLADHSQKTGRQ